MPCRFPRIAAAAGQAQLAEFRGDRDTAHARFGEALALHEQADLPVEQAETLHPAPRELTAQEGRVADLAATGTSNPQIARQLPVTVSTVETHLERIYAKLGIRSRHELIARAVEARRDPKN